MTQTSTPPVLFPAESHVRNLDIAPAIRLDFFDDLQHREGTVAIDIAQAEMLMRDLARTLGFTVTRTPATLTAPFTADQLRAADLNTTTLYFRDGAEMILGASLPFVLGSYEGDFDALATDLTAMDNERAADAF